jgi:mediator of RNA polymerase II transcription subunit 5
MSIGEYQPVYDEFGSVLLLVVVIQSRYKLDPHDLGIDSPNSFVLKYTKQACTSRSLDDLTQHENKLLSGWIRSLFETEGISDELMSMCSPKEFHLLVATLFDQSLKACQFCSLALDTLKGGFECKHSSVIHNETWESLIPDRSSRAILTSITRCWAYVVCP